MNNFKTNNAPGLLTPCFLLQRLKASFIFQAHSSSQEFLGKTAWPSIVPQGPRPQPGICPVPDPLGCGCPNTRAPFSLTGWQSPLLQPAGLHPAIATLHSALPPLEPALLAL